MSRLFFSILFFTASFITTVHADQPDSPIQNHVDRQEKVAISNFGIQSYGHFKKMIHMKETEGVVSIQEAVSVNNTYAIGAIGKGRGEITVVNKKIWLDYGNDGLGESVHEIPLHETAVLLVTAQVSKWHQIIIPENLPGNRLQIFVLEQARRNDINAEKPFPFLLEGKFDNLDLHVINGENEKFAGHSNNETFYKQHKTTKQNQVAIIVGFYSANNQGIYTHPGESWHLHAVIDDENIGAHVDGIEAQKNTILKLPRVDPFNK